MYENNREKNSRRLKTFFFPMLANYYGLINEVEKKKRRFGESEINVDKQTDNYVD